ncbi:DNA internalization-related competence protein ComEC/Rec2 [Billgrantia gudaonensis]|uniref:Competence protein ComEC n=1 Tax=Billgrantia gudaonensis TaxID=376427 RepID=A0A1G8N982_9GAMM|nr:DNA internalization-related competence protein ComEC/Rec2 [Halomonas gudaonensis]SDI76675.1 competence protein ComEC [Halomonas gudaonensis]
MHRDACAAGPVPKIGMAMPLALAALSGVGLGWLAPPGLVGGWALAVLMLVAARRWHCLLLLLVMATTAHDVLSARAAELPAGLLGDDLAVEGRLETVSREQELTRLTVRVDACRPLAADRPACDSLRRVRLSHYAAPPMQPGERWALTVRLRPPSGFANPGTFDYRAWLWREGIQATGYVRRDPAAQRLSAASASLSSRALDQLESRSLSPLGTRWLAALTLGAGERLTDDDWELLNASGTTHLMVISGLHVGLVATFALLVGRGVARLVMPGRWRLAVWPWWLAGMAAVGYAGVAGMEPPALRAMLMTLVGLWVASGRHAPGPWQGWWLALGLVVLLDPLAVWRPGLWLSFLAVALLILIWQGRSRPAGLQGWIWALVRTQLLLAPLMAAAVLLAFARLAPAAPLVNLAAVPLVSTLMVPLGLAGWLLLPIEPLSRLCWGLFDWLAHGLAHLLEMAVAGLPLWWPEPETVLPLALLLGAIALLWALPGLAAGLRWVGTLLLGMTLIGLEAPDIPPGVLRVRVQDVGQGQLIELRSAGYRLLYDTGPRFGSGFAPLQSLWPPGQHFDTVLVSHADQDHAGGLDALVERHSVDAYLAPVDAALGVPLRPCRRGLSWERDGVRYRVLWPPPRAAHLSGNDRSCVLEVAAGDERLLITGDVGRQWERAFVEDVEGPVTLLVAGHHGSATSSGAQFVQTLSPRHTVFSAGRFNGYGHPADEVVRRFRRSGSCLWSTALDGALTAWLGRGEGSIVSAARPAAWRRGGVEGACHAVESPH